MPPRNRKYPAYITPEMILECNAFVTGEDAGLLRDWAGLESAVNRCRMAVDYGQADIVEQVFLLIEGLVLNHPFIDGNKRTAVLAAELYCMINQYILVKEEADNIDLAVIVEEYVDQRKKEELYTYLREHIIEQ